MLQIRKEQKQALDEGAFKLFESKVQDHVRDTFPDEYRDLGESGVAARVAGGIEQAQQYGFDSQRDICLFVDLVFALSPDFHQSEQFPWAQSILSSTEFEDPSERMNALYQCAIDALEQ